MLLIGQRSQLGILVRYDQHANVYCFTTGLPLETRHVWQRAMLGADG